MSFILVLNMSVPVKANNLNNLNDKSLIVGLISKGLAKVTLSSILKVSTGIMVSMGMDIVTSKFINDKITIDLNSFIHDVGYTNLNVGISEDGKIAVSKDFVDKLIGEIKYIKDNLGSDKYFIDINLNSVYDYNLSKPLGNIVFDGSTGINTNCTIHNNLEHEFLASYKYSNQVSYWISYNGKACQRGQKEVWGFESEYQPIVKVLISNEFIKKNLKDNKPILSNGNEYNSGDLILNPSWSGSDFSNNNYDEINSSSKEEGVLNLDGTISNYIPTCVHIDLDKNGKCDLCDFQIEVIPPIIPPVEPGKPVPPINGDSIFEWISYFVESILYVCFMPIKFIFDSLGGLINYILIGLTTFGQVTQQMTQVFSFIPADILNIMWGGLALFIFLGCVKLFIRR